MSRVTRTSARPVARATAARTRHVNDRPTRWRLLWRRQRRFLRPAGWGAAGLAAIFRPRAAIGRRLGSLRAGDRR